jgi:hypothetical protein
MIWIAIHHLRMRATDTTKNPVALLQINHLAAHSLNGTGHFHSHNKGQFLATVVTRAHPNLSKVDAAGANANAHRLRGKIAQP